MSLSRFKGCLIGAVLGDCIGAQFEGNSLVKMKDVIEAVSTLEKNRELQRTKQNRSADHYRCCYTDDTAMARSVAASLLEKNQFDAQDMAQRFAKEYFAEPSRGYGASIGMVFKGLIEPNLKDVFRPARDQFEGRGSFGNGGAMRITPAALFVYQDQNISKLKELVSLITSLTHTHPLAINGALLQATAVDQCLRWSQNQPIDADQFIDTLITKLKPVEEESMDSSVHLPAAKNRWSERELNSTPYCAKLKRIKEFVKGTKMKTSEIVKELGNDVSAVESVPAAVFAFLWAATHTIPELQGRSRFEQTLMYAISLGGDTDTIATMAAAMAGALYGLEDVPEAWQYYCEGVAEAETTAESLYKRLQAAAEPSDGTQMNETHK